MHLLVRLLKYFELLNQCDVVCVVWCQVEVSATSWSLVESGPTHCGVWSKNLVNEEALAHWVGGGGCLAKKRQIKVNVYLSSLMMKVPDHVYVLA
jgi:hypothetical protein